MLSLPDAIPEKVFNKVKSLYDKYLRASDRCSFAFARC
jgi:hypothetical protein